MGVAGSEPRAVAGIRRPPSARPASTPGQLDD